MNGAFTRGKTECHTPSQRWPARIIGVVLLVAGFELTGSEAPALPNLPVQIIVNVPSSIPPAPVSSINKAYDLSPDETVSSDYGSVAHYSGQEANLTQEEKPSIL